MKLLTKAIEKQIPPMYSTDNIPLDEKTAVCKFFDPTGSYTWYVFEGERREDGDFEFFGYVTGCDYPEMTYFTLRQLEEIRGRWGLGIERDQSFKNELMSTVL